MALYIETKIRYDKTQDNGAIKKVTESYLVDALSFTEAEARIIEEMTPFISGDFSVSAIKKTNISELFKGDGDRWYMVKINLITINEQTREEKKKSSYILVQAFTFRDALNKFEDGMRGTVLDYEIASISETAYMDIFPANLSGNPE